MDKTKFKKSLFALLYIKGVEENEFQTNILFNLIKDDFTDEEFGNMCVEICKTEELYNKYPDPKLFYDRKKDSKKTILIEEGTFFLDDTIPQYRAVLEHLSQADRDKVCLSVWNWLMANKRNELVSEEFIIDRLKQFSPVVNISDYPTLTEMKKLLADNGGDTGTI